MTFSHPLARTSQVVPTGGLKGKVRKILLIVTNLRLDKEHKKFKEKLVKTLSDAAGTWINENPGEAVDFILINRRKKWVRDKD